MNLNRTRYRTLATLVAALAVAVFSESVFAQGWPGGQQGGQGQQYQDPNGFFSVMLPADWIVQPYPNQSFRPIALLAHSQDASTLQVYVFAGVPSAEAALNQYRANLGSHGDRVSWQEQTPVQNGGRDYRQFFGSFTFANGIVGDFVMFVRSVPAGTFVVQLSAPHGQLVPKLPLLRQIFNTFHPGA